MTHKYGQVNKGRVKTSTKFVHRCVSLTKVNKGEQSQGLLKSMKSLKTFESWKKFKFLPSSVKPQQQPQLPAAAKLAS